MLDFAYQNLQENLNEIISATNFNFLNKNFSKEYLINPITKYLTEMEQPGKDKEHFNHVTEKDIIKAYGKSESP